MMILNLRNAVLAATFALLSTGSALADSPNVEPLKKPVAPVMRSATPPVPPVKAAPKVEAPKAEAVKPADKATPAKPDAAKAPLKAAEPAKVDAPKADAKMPITIQGYGATRPDCVEWANGCQSCLRDTKTGVINCSITGISCQPEKPSCKALKGKVQ